MPVPPQSVTRDADEHNLLVTFRWLNDAHRSFVLTMAAWAVGMAQVWDKRPLDPACWSSSHGKGAADEDDLEEDEDAGEEPARSEV